MVSSLNAGQHRQRERKIPLQGESCTPLPLCSRARDTFSVITCLCVSMESRGFPHCFLSGLIWWMLPGTQHVSLETSWKSGGHWRHLKGLSEACLCCPGNVFHWGRLLFSFAFWVFFPPSKPSFSLFQSWYIFFKAFCYGYTAGQCNIKINLYFHKILTLFSLFGVDLIIFFFK